MKLAFTMLAAMALLAPRSADAQSCGNLSTADATAVLDNYGGIFYDPEQAETRGSAILELNPVADPGEMVMEDSICTAVVQRAVDRMRRGNLRWQGGRDPEYTSAVFRFGPYYVVLIREKIEITPGALAPPTGRGVTMIFRVSDLEFLLGVV